MTVHVPVPAQEMPLPFQPVKLNPLAATAVNVIEAPEGTGLLQLAPQLIPAGLEVTVPDPTRVTLSVKFVEDVAVELPALPAPLPPQPTSKLATAAGSSGIRAVDFRRERPREKASGAECVIVFYLCADVPPVIFTSNTRWRPA